MVAAPHSLALDLVTGFAYLVFSRSLSLWRPTSSFTSEKRNSRLSADEIGERSRGPIWAFLWLNLLGYSTYLLVCGAPSLVCRGLRARSGRLDVQRRRLVVFALISSWGLISFRKCMAAGRLMLATDRAQISKPLPYISEKK